MSYKANIVKVMIASPIDVAQECRVIRDVLQEWNAIHAEDRQVVLMPVGWETHSFPDMSDRPQAIINRQLLKHADLLVAVFLSLYRLSHRLPWGDTHPEIMQSTTDFHHQIADALLPRTEPVFDDTTTLHAAVDMFDSQPSLMQGLISQLLFPCQLLATRFFGRHENVHLCSTTIDTVGVTARVLVRA